MKFLKKWLQVSLLVALVGISLLFGGQPGEISFHLGALIMCTGYAIAVAALMTTVSPLREMRIRWLRRRLAETERCRLAYRDAARRNFRDRQFVREALHSQGLVQSRELTQICEVIDVARARRQHLKRQAQKLQAAIAELSPQSLPFGSSAKRLSHSH